MDRIIERLQPLSEFLEKIQDVLNFEGWEYQSQFAHTHGLGRVAIIACLLGMIWGLHAMLISLLTLQLGGFSCLDFLGGTGTRASMLWQWCFYICSMCTFHLLEFFTTAIFNPTVTSSESFLVNHSKAYTAAFLVALTEFWIRFAFFPYFSSSSTCIGIVVVLVAQFIRSWAMQTCGESFNHLIQTAKKDNHVLITHGIYKYLRHPSYVGFYYWSVGTQVVLNNYVTAFVFAAASLMFFRRRIPYEEESLLFHFPDEYETYAQKTWVGIPFIPNTGIRLKTTGSPTEESAKED